MPAGAARAADEVEGVAYLDPGWRGKQVQRRAKAEGRQHYAVLVEELRTVLETPCPDDDVTERFDGSVLSEKNGYVLAARSDGPSGLRGH